MDPITVAAKRFLRDLDRLWKRHPERIARLVARAGDRALVIKALRLAEHDPSNRRPLFLYDAAFDAAEPYFAGLRERVLSDHERVRSGAAEEGVALAPASPPVASSERSPEARAAIVLAAVADRLSSHLDGSLVALVPSSVSDARRWRDAIERLSHAARPPSLRMAVLDAEGGPLEGVLGSDGARFSFDMEELLDFAERQASRRSEGPAVPEPRPLRVLTTGPTVPTPAGATSLRSLFLSAARAAAKNDFKAAADAYRRARDLCHDEGLAVEEVAATFALGGAFLAAGARPLAQATYGQAALLAAQEKLWSLACQAKLGEAGVGWMERDFARAARAYAEAAALAARGEIALLRIEALRMEGLCHQHRGAEAEAIEAWRRAIDAGTAVDEPARRATTFSEVVTALANLLEQRGLGPQAAHVRTVLPGAPPHASEPRRRPPG